MGAAVIPARGEGGLCASDGGHRGGGGGRVARPGRVVSRADDDKVIVHHVEALHAVALGDELFLLRASMDEDDIGIAPPPGFQCLPGALRDDPHLDPGLGLEDRQDMPEQPRVLGRGGRGHGDKLLRARGQGDEDCQR
jgi:hypothetical protein